MRLSFRQFLCLIAIGFLGSLIGIFALSLKMENLEQREEATRACLTQPGYYVDGYDLAMFAQCLDGYRDR